MENILFGGKDNPLTPGSSPTNKQAIEDVQTDLLTQLKVFSVGISPMEELGLKYDPDNKDDLNQLRSILSKNLTYPSSHVAETHVRANRLGTTDIHQTLEEYKSGSMITDNTRFCICCGFMEQEETLTLTQDLKDIDHIGASTYLLFLTFKHLIFLLLIMLFVFSSYAAITNRTASRIYKDELGGKEVTEQETSYEGILAYSTGSKQLHENNFGSKTQEIQGWLGVAMISLWALVFIFIKYKERDAEKEVDIDSKTASDFSLLFENLPKGMGRQQLQKQLLAYQKQMQPHYKSELMSLPIKVVKISEATPFYLDENSFDDKQLKQIEKDYNKCKDQLVDLIKQRQDSATFETSQADRKEIYDRFARLKEEKLKRFQEIAKEIMEEKRAQREAQGDTVPAFVTFDYSYNKEFLHRTHDDTSYKFLYKLPCFEGKRKFFNFEKPDGSKIAATIKEAPEPEDILWTNLGQSTGEAIKKKLITFFVTLVLLCISFFITYGLSILQILIAKSFNHEQQKMTNTILSSLISLVISFFNIVINQILSFLTKYERNPTYIHEQTSLGLKSAFAVLVNSILIPLLVNRFLENNLYGIGGLADDVFFMAITNSFLSPVLKIFNPSYYLYRLTRWYYNRPYPRLPLSQNELHIRSELMEFSIGYEYVYIVNLFLFTCFFVSLQPIIVIFPIIGMFIMFWVLKFHLFNRCKRPTPGYSSINTAMYQLIFLGPMMYTLGSFCWPHFFQQNDRISPTPNIVALVISAVIFILPYKKIVKLIFNEPPEQNLVFHEDRIFLPSEYDRLNPLTSAQASRDYLNYVSQYRINLSKKSQQQQEEVQYLFDRQCGAGHRVQRNLMPKIANFFNFRGGAIGGGGSGMDDQLLIKQLLGGTAHNSVNPFIIGNSIMPAQREMRGGRGRGRGRRGNINMTAQNWLTGEEVNYNRNSGAQVDPSIGVSLLRPDEGETVTYETKPNRGSAKGQLNLNFGSLIREGIIGQKSQANDSEIPMNIPLNLFGNMLNLDLTKNDNPGPGRGQGRGRGRGRGNPNTTSNNSGWENWGN